MIQYLHSIKENSVILSFYIIIIYKKKIKNIISDGRVEITLILLSYTSRTFE